MFEEDERAAAADALRRFEQTGRKHLTLRSWASLPKSTQNKWLAKVYVVLDAANAAVAAKEAAS